ncbi:hypothetical protein D3C86_1631930 [compost metagenome]
MAFQDDASAVGLQVAGVNVQSAHGFRLQVGAVVLEEEGGDGAQGGLFTVQAAIDGTGVGAVASVRIDCTFASSITALGGATYGNCHSQSQRSKFADFQHFHLLKPQCVFKTTCSKQRIETSSWQPPSVQIGRPGRLTDFALSDRKREPYATIGGHEHKHPPTLVAGGVD